MTSLCRLVAVGARTEMEETPFYEEDSWYDDDWDWEQSTEPEVTYREAITQLQNLIKDRADIRIDWDQRGRGPKGDARIVFAAGAVEHRVRFRFVGQLENFIRIISSTTLLEDHHGLWYPDEQMIAARLIGDYDQLHTVALRTLDPRLKDRIFVPDSPLGQEVSWALEQSGVFKADEPVTSLGSPPRTIRIRYASQDLRFLYGPHNRDVSSVAIELIGFAAADATEAEQVLLEYGTSYLFELARGTRISLRLWRSDYRLGSRRPPAVSGKVRFPQLRYDADPVELYAAGNSADRDPIERYLKYYQVLEFYMNKAAESIAAKQGAPVNKATSPLLRPPPDNLLRREQNKLDSVIYLALTPTQVMSLLGDKELFDTLSNPQIIQDVQPITADASRQPVKGDDYRLEISTRIYEIRNKIVHMKEGGSLHPLTPYSREARDLAADIRLVRFLAEHTMRYWARPFP